MLFVGNGKVTFDLPVYHFVQGCTVKERNNIVGCGKMDGRTDITQTSLVLPLMT